MSTNTNPDRKLDHATKGIHTVALTKTATLGYAVEASATVGEILDAPADSDKVIGIAMQLGAAGDRVEVAYFGPIVPVMVGTGGATWGQKGITVADGWTDAPAHDSSGATNDPIYCIFMDTGVVGDMIPAQLVALGGRGST